MLDSGVCSGFSTDLARPEKSQISYSTTGFLDRDVEAALDAIGTAGFAKAEILGQEPHVAVPPTGHDLADFRKRLERRGLVGGTVHAPLRRTVLGAPDDEWRREKVDVLTGYLHFAASIGSTALIIHPVPNPIFVPNPEQPELCDRMRDAVRRSLDELVPIAQKVGIRMLLENLPYDCEYPFLTMAELRPLVDGYPRESLGLVVDTGHAWVKGNDPAGEILVSGPRLGGTHFQDVDFDNPEDSHWAPTHGGLDWHSIRTALAKVQYREQWTFEVVAGRDAESADELARTTRAVAASWMRGARD
jgi:sugar phosphate isomerase/epimerase